MVAYGKKNSNKKNYGRQIYKEHAEPTPYFARFTPFSPWFTILIFVIILILYMSYYIKRHLKNDVDRGVAEEVQDDWTYFPYTITINHRVSKRGRFVRRKLLGTCVSYRPVPSTASLVTRATAAPLHRLRDLILRMCVCVYVCKWDENIGREFDRRSSFGDGTIVSRRALVIYHWWRSLLLAFNLVYIH